MTIQKMLTKNIFSKKMSSKVQKNIYKILLGLFVVVYILSSGKIIPAFIIRMVHTLLGKIICIVVILMVSSENMLYGVLLTIVFVYTLTLYSTQLKEFLTTKAAAQEDEEGEEGEGEEGEGEEGEGEEGEGGEEEGEGEGEEEDNEDDEEVEEDSEDDGEDDEEVEEDSEDDTAAGGEDAEEEETTLSREEEDEYQQQIMRMTAPDEDNMSEGLGTDDGEDSPLTTTETRKKKLKNKRKTKQRNRSKKNSYKSNQ